MSEEKLINDIDVEKLDPLGCKIMGEFECAKEARLEQDKVFIRCAQNKRGVYPSGIEFSGASRAFVNLTRPRIEHAIARIYEIMRPEGELPFTIDPTPAPDMPMIVAMLSTQGASQEDIEKAVKIKAEQGAQQLTRYTADGMDETKWPKKFHTLLNDMATYGTGVMIGPLAAPSKKTPKASLRGLGEEGNLMRPEMEVVSPLRFYPAPGSTSIEECPWAIIYNVIDKTTLSEFVKQEDLFDTEAVKDIISNGGDGNWIPEKWETDILMASNNDESGPNGKFVLLRRWGYLSGQDLRDIGQDVGDDELFDQVMADVWVIAGKVISLRISNLFRDRLPFYACSMFENPESIFGVGIAEAMFDSQDSFNACERALADNMAFSCAGPITQLISSRLLDPKDASKIVPKAVIRLKDSELRGGDGRAVFFDYTQSHINELLAKQDRIMAQIQEQTGIPNALMGLGGEGTHNRTSTGAALQFNNAITPLKGIVMRLENDLIIPMIEKFKEFFESNEGYVVEGDFKISPRGVSGLMAREIMSQKIAMLFAAGSQNQELMKRLDISRLVDLDLRNSGLLNEKVTYTETELMAMERARAEAEANAQAMQAQGVAQAKADVETKQRAETSPVDTYIAAMNAAPDGTPVKLQLIRHTLILKDLMTPELEQAFAAQMEMYNVNIEDEAHKLGSDRAMREAEPLIRAKEMEKEAKNG